MFLLDWLVDNAIWFYLLVGMTAVALVVLWWNNRQKVYLYVLLGVLGLVPIIWLLTVFIITPRQKIWLAIDAMADGFSTNKPAQVVEHLSRDFKHGDITKGNAKEKIERVISQFGLADVYVWNYVLEELDRSKGHARVSFYLKVSSQTAGDFMIYRCEAEFVREDDVWRMKSFQRFRPMGNKNEPIPYPLP